MKERFDWKTGGRALSLEERKIARRLRIAAPQAEIATTWVKAPGSAVAATSKSCSWCNTDPQKAASRHEGPHATWCPHYRARSVWDWWSPTEPQPNTDIG